MTDKKALALTLAKIGLHVFPVAVKVKEDNPYRTTKKPLTNKGFLDATTDPKQIQAWWGEHPDAWPGVAMGPSGLLAVDFDVHKDPDGTVVVDGLENFADLWVDLPDTFMFESVSGAGGTQYVYRAPEGKHLGPTQDYRGIKGLDTRAGGSYSVFTSAPESYDDFKMAPEWACDERPQRDLSLFEGDSRQWFDSLVPGKPNALVRKAIETAQKKYAEQGNDLTHSDIVSLQHHAVRLGAEGHPGVEEYLDVLKDLTLSREGEHSRNPDEYEHEFAEALASGIEKHGGAIELLQSLPDFNISNVPSAVPDRLISGEPGDRMVFSELLRAMLKEETDDLVVLSTLWNAPTTRDLAREWGLEFVLRERIQKARKNPEPEGENPVLLRNRMDISTTAFLTPEEKEIVRQHPTFIDAYLAATEEKKGFVQPAYAVPAAWTLLSMALGPRIVVPHGKAFGGNLWFLIFGEASSGKSSEYQFMKKCTDLLLKDGQSHYNLGVGSSPEAMHEALLERDGKPSILMGDEAAKFFKMLARKEWMSGLDTQMSDWYDGEVSPLQKVRLKELKGKDATTSFGIYMIGTPDNVLDHLSVDMFDSGFLNRMNWGWAPEPDEDDERRFMVSRSKTNKNGESSLPYELVTDLIFAQQKTLPRTVMDWTDEAEDRLVAAHMRMWDVVKTRDQKKLLDRAIVRLKETMWKCAALLAVWRGETVIREIDAMTALYYAETWFNNLFRVVDVAGEGEFNQQCNRIEAFVAAKDRVARYQIYDHFRSIVQKSPRELEDRISFLVDSNRIMRDKDGKYYANGKKED